MNRRFLTILILMLFMSNMTCQLSYADNITQKQENENKTQYGKVQYSKKEFKKSIDALTNKFANINIQASYNDMLRIIIDNEGNDYYMLLLADKATELGFFDLANLAFSKVIDYDIANVDSENTRKLFFPKEKMGREDIITLAEAYSNIQYNDRSNIAINDVKNKIDDYISNDYANYVLALGYLKLNDVENSQKCIEQAISINPDNLNYKILQSKVTANTKKTKKALKLVKETQKENIEYYPLKKQIDANEQYIKYKTEKQAWLKDYHLGYYYYLTDDNSKALRILQSAISKNNSRNALLYSLMSRIYIKNGDYERANTVATKAYKYNLSNIDTLLTMGDIAYENNKYKQALKYYKQAAKSRSSVTEAKLKMADTYSKLNNVKTSNSIYEKIVKNDKSAYEAYYHIALSDPESELTYLKKSVAINPNFKDGWIDLSRVMIEKGNLTLAKKYLENAYYIDDNDFRYYYYQSLLIKKSEEMNKNREE